MHFKITSFKMSYSQLYKSLPICGGNYKLIHHRNRQIFAPFCSHATEHQLHRFTPAKMVKFYLRILYARTVNRKFHTKLNPYHKLTLMFLCLPNNCVNIFKHLKILLVEIFVLLGIRKYTVRFILNAFGTATQIW